MRLSVRGNIQKIDDGWEIHFPILGLRGKSPKCKGCFDHCGSLLLEEIKQYPFKYSFCIGENSEVYLLVDFCQEFFDYLSYKMSSWPTPSEWDKELHESIRYHRDIED